VKYLEIQLCMQLMAVAFARCALTACTGKRRSNRGTRQYARAQLTAMMKCAPHFECRGGARARSLIWLMMEG